MVVILDLASGDQFELSDELSVILPPSDPPMKGDELLFKEGRGFYPTAMGRCSGDPTLEQVELASVRVGATVLVADPEKPEIYWRSRILERK